LLANVHAEVLKKYAQTFLDLNRMILSLPRFKTRLGTLAQMVEQWTENPCVPSSILGGTTINPGGENLRDFFIGLIWSENDLRDN
jgi:hypothetical protein